jgi:hypothetical protein
MPDPPSLMNGVWHSAFYNKNNEHCRPLREPNVIDYSLF